MLSLALTLERQAGRGWEGGVGGGGGGGGAARVSILLLQRSPALSLEFTILGEIFAYVTVFNPNIEVVIFRLRGGCMLGVLLLPAFTRLGHECQDLLSPCVLHACTD